jgi:chromosome transmission fidelity protein 18
MSNYSPGIPTSFDPALLHSELEFLDDAPPSLCHSDELCGIEESIAEERAKKTSAGIVIQHRAWNALEAFRSEEDYPISIRDTRNALQLD